MERGGSPYLNYKDVFCVAKPRDVWMCVYQTQKALCNSVAEGLKVSKCKNKAMCYSGLACLTCETSSFILMFKPLLLF